MARSRERLENKHILELAMQAQRRQIESEQMMLTLLNSMKNNKKKEKKGGIKTKNVEIPPFEGESQSYQEWKK